MTIEGWDVGNQDEQLNYLLFCERLAADISQDRIFRGVLEPDEILSELWIHFSDRFASGETPSPGLAYTVMKRKVIDILRRESRKKPYPDINNIINKSRSASSYLHAKQEWEKFARQLNGLELQTFKYIESLYRNVPPLVDVKIHDEISAWEVEQDRSLITDIAHHFGISITAATKRLSRIRAKYVIFRENMRTDKERRITLFDTILAKLKVDGHCDGNGWVSIDGASKLIGLDTEDIILRCETGRIDAIGVADHGVAEFYIDPCELVRWTHRGDRRNYSYINAMQVLSNATLNGVQCHARRAVWEYRRVIMPIAKSPFHSSKSATDYKLLDCYYKLYQREGTYAQIDYLPTIPDLNACDWIVFHRTPKDKNYRYSVL